MFDGSEVIDIQFEDKLPLMKSNIIILKIGTSSICDEKTFIPKLSYLCSLVEVVVKLKALNHQVIIVSSGAVGVGLRKLNYDKKPKHLSQIQAVAAVGQGRLIALYDSLFSQFNITIAQVLLTRDNLADRSQYLNARNTFKELLAMDVVPIVNENDTVCHAELRFGDNDTLSAITAGMVDADILFLLTDVDGLYEDNPRSNLNAKAIKIVHDIPMLKKLVNVSSAGSSIGTGGMVTKLVAAELASSAGCSTVITLGSKPHRILEIMNDILENENKHDYEPIFGTYFPAKGRTIQDRKWWILHGLSSSGQLYVDAGAAKAILSKGSLFAAGIVECEGIFSSQQCIKILRKDNRMEIAKGIVNYSSSEISRIKGLKSSEIGDILGYFESEEVIFRGNIALIE